MTPRISEYWRRVLGELIRTKHRGTRSDVLLMFTSVDERVRKVTAKGD
jgi:hypothetical protein